MFFLPKTMSAVQERDYANYIVRLLRDILDIVECFLCIVSFPRSKQQNMHNFNACWSGACSI